MFSKTPSNSFGKMHLVACCSRHRESISIKASELWDDALNVVQLDDVFMVGICRIDNEYIAYDLVCPHHGANLGEGSYDGRNFHIRCPWHGYTFDLRTGNCIRNPNVEGLSLLRTRSKFYEPALIPKHCLKFFEVSVEKDVIKIDLSVGTLGEL